jgi:predicted nucleotidyltransferase
MSARDIQKEMLKQVALALDELRETVTFVGGCTTALLITDEFTVEQVRHTEDVDLIVSVIGYVEYNRLKTQLQSNGFKETPLTEENWPICAMKLGDLRVDIMPDDEAILGFSNRWYKYAMESAIDYVLDEKLSIKVVNPIAFVATKLEAYKGRGNQDPLASQDIEDLLNLIDGRESLAAEIRNAPEEVKAYIAQEIQTLMTVSDFDYAVQSTAEGSPDREDIIYDRLKAIS